MTNKMKFEVYYFDPIDAKNYGEVIAAFANYYDAAQYFDESCSIAHCKIRPINGAKFPKDAESISEQAIRDNE